MPPVRVVYEKGCASQSSTSSGSTRAFSTASVAAISSISSRSLLNACTLSRSHPVLRLARYAALISLGLGGLRVCHPSSSFPSAGPFL